jgi:hypothetical protein
MVLEIGKCNIIAPVFAKHLVWVFLWHNMAEDRTSVLAQIFLPFLMKPLILSCGGADLMTSSNANYLPKAPPPTTIKHEYDDCVSYV